MIWISHTHHAIMNTAYSQYNHVTSSKGIHIIQMQILRECNNNCDYSKSRVWVWDLINLDKETTACCINPKRCICRRMCFHIISFCVMKPKMDSFIIFIIIQILIWKNSYQTHVHFLHLHVPLLSVFCRLITFSEYKCVSLYCFLAHSLCVHTLPYLSRNHVML